MNIKKAFMVLLITLNLTGCLFAVRKLMPKENIGPVPNLEFNINKTASLFGQAFINSEIDSPRFSEFSTKLSEASLTIPDPKRTPLFVPRTIESPYEDFVDCIIHNKIENQYTTPEFSKILGLALLEYDLIFDKRLEDLINRKNELSDFCKIFFLKPKPFFSSVFKFYQTTLKKDHKFKVYLYLSSNKNEGRVTTFCNNILLQFMYSKRNKDISLILHEVCRKLYETQPINLSKKFEHFFLNHKSPYAKAMYIILNEVLATAIGNRWALMKMNHEKESKNKVHNNKYIDGLSIAILSLVMLYLEKDKKIDGEFLERSIQILAKTFIEADRAFDIMFSTITLLCKDKQLLNKSYHILNKEFHMQSVFTEEKENSPLMLVFIGDNLKDKSLKKIHYKIPKKIGDFLHVAIDYSKKIYVIIKTKDEAKILKAAKLLKEQKVAVDGFDRDL